MEVWPSPSSTRHDGVPARSIRLSDGLEWGFSLPTRRLSPKVEVHLDDLGREVEKIAVQFRFGYPCSIEILIDDLRSSCEGGTVAEQYKAFFSLAAALLRRAHDVSLTTACSLLEVPEHDIPRLVSAVLATISEHSPEQGREAQGATLS